MGRDAFPRRASGRKTRRGWAVWPSPGVSAPLPRLNQGGRPTTSGLKADTAPHTQPGREPQTSCLLAGGPHYDPLPSKLQPAYGHNVRAHIVAASGAVMKRLGFLLVAVGSLFLPSAGAPQSAVPVPQLGEPVIMTYWEARHAGFHVPQLPAETGFRVCTNADFHRGFSSAEEAERSLAEYEAKWGEAGPDICQVDPTTATIAVFPPGRGPPSMLQSTRTEGTATAQLSAED